MRLTSKGQVTIPLGIREQLGQKPHMEVEFELDGDAVRIRKARHIRRGQVMVDGMRRRATTRLTTDEILLLTRR